MRKRIIILMAGVSAALAGCVKEEAGGSLAPGEISYRVVQGNTAQADMTGKTEYPKEVPFASYAYFLPAGKAWNTHKGDAEMYINNAKIEHDAGNNSWHAATTYYWPKQGSLTFFAYSPATIASHGGFSRGKEGITLTGWNVNANSGVDFMVADIAADKRGNEDNYAYNGVPTLFRHKLARVSVKARLDNTYDGKTVRLKSVTLTYIYTEGDYANNNWTGQRDARYIGQYSNQTGQPLTATAAIDAGTQKRIVMPQALAANAGFNIAYEVTTDATGVTESFTKDILIKSVTPAWYMNTDITYTLIISLGTNYIEFDTTVTDWVEHGGTGLTIE